jgi:sulfate transport system ATP-binding protein
MNKGRIEQIGTPEELDQAPATPFAFEFLGESNRLACEVAGGVARAEGFSAPVLGSPKRDGQGVALFRPHDARLHLGPAGHGLPVRVVKVSGRGAARRVECQALGGERFSVELGEAQAGPFEPGQRARLTAERVMVDFNAERPARPAPIAALRKESP